MLYLLHGAVDTYGGWTRNTDVEALTAHDDMLVVMPAASFPDGSGNYQDGWYSDWINGGAGGPPAWETFHLTELRQLLQRNYHAGTPMAVAGLSMGGYGAINYAARHPDLFRAAASFSGVLDIQLNATDFLDHESTLRWGDRTTNADNWAAHNPVKFAASLKGMPLYISYGNGDPGPLDPPGTTNDQLEQWVSAGDDQFVQALKDAGVEATINAYGSGTHSWPYWQRELHASMPMLLTALGLGGK
jgi:S-formylglutathione hydrolase FrmB